MHHCNKILLVDWTHQLITLSPTSKNSSGRHHRGIKVITLFPDNGGREGLKELGVLFLNDTAGEPKSTSLLSFIIKA